MRFRRAPLWAFLLLAIPGVLGCALFGGAFEEAALPPGAVSDHFDGDRFFNPGISLDRGVGDMLRWWLAEGGVAWPDQVPNGIYDPPPQRVGAGGISVTFIGHATFLVQADGLNILTDPIFSARASPVSWAGPKRVHEPGLALAALPPIDLVLISHNHYDHLDLPSLREIAARWNPIILMGLGNCRLLDRRERENCRELDWWKEVRLADGARVIFVPAQHWSRRALFDRRRALWGGFVVENGAGRVYFAGDTGYPAQFAAIRERLGAPDLALLPIGAYEPRWFMAPQHVDPEEAVLAHRTLDARFSIGMHFGTFKLTDEAIDAPPEALAAARRRHEIPSEAFRTLGFGETLRIPSRQQASSSRD